MSTCIDSNHVIDFSRAAIQNYGPKSSSEQQVAMRARNLLRGNPELKASILDPLNTKLLFQVPKDKGFYPLAAKRVSLLQPPVMTYKVFTHDSLKGDDQVQWLVKSGAAKIVSDENPHVTPEDSLLRVPMAERMRKVVKALGYQNEVIIPRKMIVSFEKNPDTQSPVTESYFVMSEAVPEVLSPQETIKRFSEFSDQKLRETAVKIALIVRHSGLRDASVDNIRLTQQGKIVFFDTEPGDVLITAERYEQEGKYRHFEQAGREGLDHLNMSMSREAYKRFFLQKGEEYPYCQSDRENEPILPEFYRTILQVNRAQLDPLPLVEESSDEESVQSFQRPGNRVVQVEDSAEESETSDESVRSSRTFPSHSPLVSPRVDETMTNETYPEPTPPSEAPHPEAPKGKIRRFLSFLRIKCSQIFCCFRPHKNMS